MRIIAGSLRGQHLQPPRDRRTRPALDRLRESIFAVLADGSSLGECPDEWRGVEGRLVLDLWAGTGAFGLEALSRGARRCHFVELSRDGFTVLERNIHQLGCEAWSSAERADALTSPDREGRDARGEELPALRGEGAAFGLIFLDPPFDVFRPEGDAQAIAGVRPSMVFDRARELLESDLTTDDCIAVLRTPSAWRDESPFRAIDTRVQRESTVHFLGRDSWML